ncbi:protein sprouty isoform X2 [Anabrus simplex]
MAHHGDLATSSDLLGFPNISQLARVHRPRLSIMTPPPPSSITLQPLSAPATSEVTLSSPRPDGERTVNEYVETPFRPNDVLQSAAKTVLGGSSKHATTTNTDLIRGTDVRLSSSSARDPHHQTLHLPIGQHHNNNKSTTRSSSSKRVVTKQPGATATFKKEAAPAGSTQRVGDAGTSGDCFRGSIICPECGRCRCESCRKPRPLPSRWLCNNACFCSAETTLDYASCLCCVKGLFYHCSKDYELDRDGTSCADDPCSCGPHRLKARWGCLGVLSLVLPCLWCYWPLRGCVGLCEKCYARYSSQGCRCEPRHPKLTDVTPEKRLLDTSPDF